MWNHWKIGLEEIMKDHVAHVSALWQEHLNMNCFWQKCVQPHLQGVQATENRHSTESLSNLFLRFTFTLL